jgi:hypothetical protein
LAKPQSPIPNPHWAQSPIPNPQSPFQLKLFVNTLNIQNFYLK